MKKHFYLLLSILIVTTPVLYAQNAQQLYFNQLAIDYHYQAASFVVDTPPNTSSKRAFLLWSKNFNKDTGLRGFTLDEFDNNGNFLSERFNPQPSLPTEYILPKKIIKAKMVSGYYLLAYAIKSFNTINGFQVYSTPLVIRLDLNLNPLWVEKVHYTTINSSTAQALIEYNDIIETTSSDLVLAGHYADVPGQQSRVLLTRLNQAGAVLWSYQYYLNTCNAEALSLTELSNRNLAVTGYIENCSSGPAGARNLLYATFNAAGTPVVIERLQGGQALAGSKIVRHTSLPNADELFITGYIDVITPTGAVNKQVLLVDVKESGGVISVNHIGDAGEEAASDLTYTNVGNSYELYFTGYTSSYYPNVKTEVFLMRLKYGGGSAGLVEFATFPSLNSSYVARRGAELKSAGKGRYAVLANTDMSISPQLSTYSHVLIRDYADNTGNCIKLHFPPVTVYQLGVIPAAYNYVRLPFTAYRDQFIPFNRVFPRLECGTFIIDPYTASNLRTAVPPVTAPFSSLPAVKGPAAIRVYPNPVSDRLYIDYGAMKNKGRITATIYSTDMRLLRSYVLPGANRDDISLQGLNSGVYFLQLQYKGTTKVFEVKKE